MGLGYLILSTKSEQDKYLTGNPQFTFFKSVYRRHTNFAIDYQFVGFVGDSTNTFGKKIYIDIPKNGDLLHKMFLIMKIQGVDGLRNVTPTAYSFIEYVDLFIGGQRIDRHYGIWLQIWHELFESNDVVLGKLVSTQPLNGDNNTIYLPLRFWFNNNVGLSLPLISLQYSDIKLEIKFNDKDFVQTYSEFRDDISGINQSVSDSTLKINNVQLLGQFIHLDNDERRLFSSREHEYLITQVQNSINNQINLYNNETKERFEKIVHKTPLRLSKPVKELVWVFQDSNSRIHTKNSYIEEYFNKGILHNNFWRNHTIGSDHMIGAVLNINGKDMTEELGPNFYRGVQNYQYHSGSGLSSINNTNVNVKSPASQYIDLTKGNAIYSYSFSLNPEEFQPSGSLNFTNVENAHLKYRLYRPFNTSSVNIKVATTESISLTNPPTTIDAVELSIGDVIIVKNQTINELHNNGIYVYNGSGNSLTRHPEYNDSNLLLNASGTLFKISAGTVNNNKEFILNFKDQGTIDTQTHNLFFHENTSSWFNLKSKTLHIFAVNYNVLRIMSGMASLAFSI